jgi:hypothetical protein
MARRSDIDWDAMEGEYRINKRTLRDIAADYGCTEGAIRKQAKKLGWERDLSAKVAAKAEALVIGAERDEFDSSGYVYAIYLDSPERYYKIGMAKHFSLRFSAHQCASPFRLCVACVYFVPNMRAEEITLHNAFADKRVRGEWFKLDADDLTLMASRSLLVEV